jgi:hypothetical protein
MKKLKLAPEQLQVVSFAADEAEEGAGTVNGLQMTNLIGCTNYGCQPRTGGRWTCLCTQEVDCYPSKYCSGPGCVMTVYDGCMTSNEAAC